jgi:hypothetical protein
MAPKSQAGPYCEDSGGSERRRYDLLRLEDLLFAGVLGLRRAAACAELQDQETVVAL